ncbi:MAG: phosphate acyltransferase PlsX [Gammaproteobacteria bacterium]|nr:phosphate acyltransferase PlsX [Gammaproteobacteria bacterium]
MSETVTIALDAMGGDHGPGVVVPAALEILDRHRDVALVLVGDEAELEAHCGEARARFAERLRIHHASQVVGMDESPANALRGKKDSSMRVAIDLVKKGAADACVSAGNTGALMATARFVLKTLPGIDRPAIITAIPSIRGHTHVLDLGANVGLDAKQLFQLAVMGATLVRAVDSLERPRVGLLNVGEEEIKGNEQVKEAHALLMATDLNYIGFVEGDDVYTGDADVIVCDGFVGNVALKTSEGLAQMVSHFMRQAFSRNPLTRLAGLVAAPVLRSFKRRIDPRRYNGASLVGLQGIVIKSHGGADVLAFANAIEIARVEVAKAVPKKIRQEIGHLLQVSATA